MVKWLLMPCLILFLSAAAGAEPEQIRGKVNSRANAVKVRLYDLPLQDQDGRSLRFKSDAIGNRLVAITFIYTTCTTICPVLDAIFSRTQELLGSRLGRDIRLISMSIDPATDIPQRLKQYAGRQKAGPGWLFLTGKKPEVDRILTGLDVYAADRAKHPPAVLIGDGRRGVWRRLNGFPSAEQVIKTLNELEEERVREDASQNRAAK